MFIYIISSFCDYMIFIHKFIKNFLNPESIEDYILNVTMDNVIETSKDFNIKLYPTRQERYLLYKKLKGKNSPIILYSYGEESKNTRKKLIIKKK